MKSTAVALATLASLSLALLIEAQQFLAPLPPLAPPAPSPPQKADVKLGIQRDSGPEALEMIKKRGFIGQEFTIKSRDGTPLSVYRIINPLADQHRLNRWPVLVMHGVSGDAAQMMGHSERSYARRPLGEGQFNVDLDTDTCLAFMLSNNNFDVFMGDARGTNLNNHRVLVDLNPLEANKYWNFSIDEQALHDLPAFVDFVLEHTGQPKLHYVGFSESTTFMFALLSTYPEYQLKLASFVALAPVAYVHHATGMGVGNSPVLAMIPDSINGNVVPQPLVDTLAVTLRNLCQLELITRTLCAFIVSSVSGAGTTGLSHGFFATALKTTSIKAAKHFLQLLLHQRFGMYDHGEAGNLRAYGVPYAPKYDLSAIRLPGLIIFRGAKDPLSDPVDQQLLIDELGLKPYIDINLPNYNHLDLIMATDLVEKVNAPATQAMLDLLKQTTLPHNLSLLRDSTQLTAEQAQVLAQNSQHKPIEVSLPDGTRDIEIKSNLMGNLLDGLAETFAITAPSKERPPASHN